MKKLLLITLILIGTLSYSQSLNNTELLESGRVGIGTVDKDTLYLLDCQMGYNIKETWNNVTKEQLKQDGIENPPVFVMVDSIKKFKLIVERILNEKNNKMLNTSKLDDFHHDR